MKPYQGVISKCRLWSFAGGDARVARAAHGGSQDSTEFLPPYEKNGGEAMRRIMPGRIEQSCRGGYRVPSMGQDSGEARAVVITPAASPTPGFAVFSRSRPRHGQPVLHGLLENTADRDIPQGEPLHSSRAPPDLFLGQLVKQMITKKTKI